MPEPKQPPYSIEAEQSVLGGLMLDNRAWNELADRLAEVDFYRADHQLIYRAISDLVGAARPCDFVTLSEYLRTRGKLEEAGGLAYLGTLANDTPSAANVLAYADIVRERSILRSLIAAGNDIGELGYRPEGRAPDELVDIAEQKVFVIRERGVRAKRSYLGMPQVMTSVYDKISDIRSNPQGTAGLSTGFAEFDNKTSGLGPGDLMILAARPSMGKCLAHDSELVMDDGSIASIEEVYRRRSGRVGTLRPDFKLDRAEPGGFLDDGLKPVFEVSTRLGRRVETTLPHPFLTLGGWKPLAALQAGDYVAVPRSLPVFGDRPLRECEVKLLAYLIGDGGLTGSVPRFTNINSEIQQDFASAVTEFGGLRCVDIVSPQRAASFAVVSQRQSVAVTRTEFAARASAFLQSSGQSGRALAQRVGVTPATVGNWLAGRTVPDAVAFESLCRVLGVQAEELAPDGHDAARRNRPNPLVIWLGGLGLAGKGAGEKVVPGAVFTLPRQQLALFLNRLFATDGWATVLASGQSQIGYSTISERLARQVQHLLLRFGVIAKLRQRWVKYRDARRPAWQLDITDARALQLFTDEIGIFGKGRAVQAVRAALDGRRLQTNVDLIPVGIWHRIEQLKAAMSWAELARRAGFAGVSNIHPHRRALSRDRLARIAMVLDAPELMNLAHSDVHWDRIESITPLGDKQVYDLTMPQTQNFIANDICVHNTTLAMNIAENVAFDGKKGVAVFSMEMSAEQLGFRVLSSKGGIPMQKLRSGELDDQEMDQLTWTVGRLREAPLFIDETGGLSPMELRAKARRLALKENIKLIVVDYIQLMQVPGTRENRTNEISEISRSLKTLAKELEIPVIALSQLNRGVEQRDNKRPRMSDLRESGGIEQDADLVVFIYRDWVYDKSKDERQAEIIIAKQRNGPLATVNLDFFGQYTRFDNPSSPYADGNFGE